MANAKSWIWKGRSFPDYIAPANQREVSTSTDSVVARRKVLSQEQTRQRSLSRNNWRYRWTICPVALSVERLDKIIGLELANESIVEKLIGIEILRLGIAFA